MNTDRTAGGWVGIYLRGVAMGIAEIVPGVSGGTIAFVSGIYEELVSSLAAFGPKSAKNRTFQVKKNPVSGRVFPFG